MTSCGEELRNTGCIEAGLGETESSSETRTASADNDGIVLVILQIPVSVCHSDQAGKVEGVEVYLSRHTITGYLELTKGEASLARRGRPPVNILATVRLH